MRHVRTALGVVALAAAYAALAHLSWAVGMLPGNVSPVWPSAGLAIAAVLLFGPVMLVGVFAGELLANGMNGLPVAVAAGMATGNVLEAWAARWLLTRWPAFRSTLQRGSDVVGYVLCAAVVATALSATVGVSSLLLGGVLDGPELGRAWLLWWTGDALGAMVAGTALLVWAQPSERPCHGRLEALAGYGGLVATAVLVFFASAQMPFVVFPFVVWAALRFTQRGAVTTVLLVSALAVTSTARGVGPFAGPDDVGVRLWYLDCFLLVLAGTALVLASVVTERDRARRTLAAANETLERRVEERTLALETERARLAEAQRVGQIGSWEWDLARDRITWSDELYRMFGVKPGAFEADYEAYLRLLHDEDRAAVDREVRRGLAERAGFEIVHRVVRRDGDIRWVRSNGRVSLDASGEVVRMTGTAQDITASVELQVRLEHQARHDSLTGLPNRGHLAERLALAVRRRTAADVERHDASGRAVGPHLAVLFLDVDRFKWINDSLGHTVGDQVLQTIAARLRGSVRSDAFVARFGGDEFVALCPGVAGVDDAKAIAQRLLQELRKPFSLEGRTIPLNASIGIALSRRGCTADELLSEADLAMYRAKERGGGSAAVFDQFDSQGARSRFHTASELNEALGADQVRAHYQPIIELASGRVVGVEALARWQHPHDGLLPPAAFIDVAEQSGVIVELGAVVLEQACRDVAAWNTELGPEKQVTVAVNVSARQISHGTLADVVARCLEVSGLPPHMLCLELTESALMDDATTAGSTIERLRGLGVRLSVDDFGTGYSSLLYLRRFPVTSLKIDRSFVSGLPSEADDTAIVRGVIELAHGLGLAAVAEGVETLEQFALLRAAGCEQAQGYLWSGPRSGPDLLAWLVRQDGVASARTGVVPRIPAQGRRDRTLA